MNRLSRVTTHLITETIMTSFRMNKTNRFWQECQTIGCARANEKRHEIQTDPTPQAGGSAA